VNQFTGFCLPILHTITTTYAGWYQQHGLLMSEPEKFGEDMRKTYDDLRDYHISENGIAIQEREWQGVRALVLNEGSNEVHVRQSLRNSLVLTLDGSASHMTRMGGIKDDSPSKPGAVCFIPKGIEVHLAWQNHAALQKSILLEFDQTIFEKYAPEVISSKFDDGNLIPRNFQTCEKFEYILRILGQEVSPEGNRGLIFAESAVRLLALQIAASAWSHSATPVTDQMRTDPRASRAIEYVEAHYTTDISLLEISEAAGLSVTQLTQVFQLATGQTPYSYVISRRLRRAVQLLRFKDMPIAHIAIDVGFADQAHMTRTFKRRFGKTPKLIRQEG
jgi:AraC-like DNA-binding protein